MHSIFDERRYLIPFRSTLLPQIFTDTLVVGGGVAGARAALAAAGGGADAGEHPEAILLSKGRFTRTNTAWAQGGIAAVMRDDDSVESHRDDTIEAGAGLCDVGAVELVVREGRERVEELIRWGVRFDASGESLAVGREGGHSASRIYHAGGDRTGREIQRALTERLTHHPRVRVFDGCFALDLITPTDEPGSPVLGAMTHHPKYGLQVIWARTTIVCSGGAGQLFRETTNPAAATADGIAMAYRAGATLGDMAFVQFHPTTLYLPGANRALITEAVRGEGAYLLDAAGERFMVHEHPLAELAPRDVVASAIVRQIARQGGTNVWLDCRHLDGFAARFPGIDALLRRFELDPVSDLIPVHPAAHYMIGGVKADEMGRTDVPGLLAAGEAACTGLNGANRLASNSLLEGLVMGERAGRHARERLESDAGVAVSGGRPPSVISDIRPSDSGELDLHDVRSSLRSAMWRNVGIERAGARLEGARDMFDFWARYTLDKIFDEPEGWEAQNLLLAGALVTRSALAREETRGCHVREDFPERCEPRHDAWRRGSSEPVWSAVDAGAVVG